MVTIKHIVGNSVIMFEGYSKETKKDNTLTLLESSIHERKYLGRIQLQFYSREAMLEGVIRLTNIIANIKQSCVEVM